VLRAAVIGLGVGEQHIAGYRAHPDCEVVALCDLDAKRLTAVGERTGVAWRTREPEELLTSPDIDVVSVASYDDAHYVQIRTALSHGKHVFAEKPLVLFEHEARELRDLLAVRPDLVLSSNVPLRRSPRFVELRERVAAGDLGELFHVEGDYEYGRRHKLTDGWRGRIPYYSVVLGGAIHLVDLLLWITGKPVAEVTAAIGNRIATRGTQFSHDDFVMAILRFADGMSGKVTANLGCVAPHFHQVKLFGTDGTFVNGLPDAVIHRQEGSERITTPYPGVTKSSLIPSFIEQIATGSPAEVTAADVFATLDVCFAIERALHERAPVRISPE
jgi:predicted dehydrogenase